MGTRSLREIIEDLTWDDIVADGLTTTDEIEAQLRAKGVDPTMYDYLYE
ncbi:hypothetical protein [Nocardioides zhouii]|nr:hypothetical protein [Nocardioides zhouii]